MTRLQRADRSERDAAPPRRTPAGSERRARAWVGALVAVTGLAAALPALASSCTTNATPNDFDATGSTSGDPGGTGSGSGGGGDLLDGGFTSPLTISPA